MKKMVMFLVLVVFVFKLFSQCANTANIYSFSYGGKSYEVVKEMKTWVTAAACAVERGGYLVEINSQAEQTAVYSAIITGAGVSPTYTMVGDGGGIAYVWIGATDMTTEGTWLWNGDNNTAGTHFWSGQGAAGANNGASVGGTYNNWGGKSTGTIKEPDDCAGQDAAAIGLSGWPSGTTMLGIAGEWNDVNISNSLYFVIEKDNTETAEVSLEIQWSICPNPATNKIAIVFSKQIQSVEIFNLLGEKCFEKNTDQNAMIIDVTSLKRGIYFVVVNDGKQKHNKKIVLI